MTAAQGRHWRRKEQFGNNYCLEMDFIVVYTRHPAQVNTKVCIFFCDSNDHKRGKATVGGTTYSVRAKFFRAFSCFLSTPLTSYTMHVQYVRLLYWWYLYFEGKWFWLVFFIYRRRSGWRMTGNFSVPKLFHKDFPQCTHTYTPTHVKHVKPLCIYDTHWLHRILACSVVEQLVCS